jgi:alpha/beta superfamily hydrolase
MSFTPAIPEAMAITGPCGMLDAIVEDPQLPLATAVAVICHPHPLHGGTMTNKVVQTLARACNECGAPAVRFNYRGVGKSAGTYDEGRGETDDALAVIAWARVRWPGRSIWLAGFSFGGGVALQAALRTQVACLVTVAPAAARAASPTELPNCPWLLVQGDADDVIPAELVLSWAKSLQVIPDIKVLAGAGHFFHGRLTELRELVRQWIAHAVQS